MKKVVLAGFFLCMQAFSMGSAHSVVLPKKPPLKIALQKMKYHVQRPFYGERKAISKHAKRLGAQGEEFKTQRENALGDKKLDSGKLRVTGRVIKEAGETLWEGVKNLFKSSLLPQKKSKPAADNDGGYVIFDDNGNTIKSSVPDEKLVKKQAEQANKLNKEEAAEGHEAFVKGKKAIDEHSAKFKNNQLQKVDQQKVEPFKNAVRQVTEVKDKKQVNDDGIKVTTLQEPLVPPLELGYTPSYTNVSVKQSTETPKIASYKLGSSAAQLKIYNPNELHQIGFKKLVKASSVVENKDPLTPQKDEYSSKFDEGSAPSKPTVSAVKTRVDQIEKLVKPHMQEDKQPAQVGALQEVAGPSLLQKKSPTPVGKPEVEAGGLSLKSTENLPFGQDSPYQSHNGSIKLPFATVKTEGGKIFYYSGKPSAGDVKVLLEQKLIFESDILETNAGSQYALSQIKDLLKPRTVEYVYKEIVDQGVLLKRDRGGELANIEKIFPEVITPEFKKSIASRPFDLSDKPSFDVNIDGYVSFKDEDMKI